MRKILCFRFLIFRFLFLLSKLKRNTWQKDNLSFYVSVFFTFRIFFLFYVSVLFFNICLVPFLCVTFSLFFIYWLFSLYVTFVLIVPLFYLSSFSLFSDLCYLIFVILSLLWYYCKLYGLAGCTVHYCVSGLPIKRHVAGGTAASRLPPRALLS